MKTTTAPTINRLATVEEELIDRIYCEQNGKMIFNFCEKLAAILSTHTADDLTAGGLRDKLCASLRETLKCTANQAASLIELSLELMHTRRHNHYSTRCDLNTLIFNATKAVGEASSN